METAWFSHETNYDLQGEEDTEVRELVNYTVHLILAEGEKFSFKTQNILLYQGTLFVKS